MEIKYVKHPVTAEEKKKLRDAGFKIVDERFKPKEVKRPTRSVKIKS